jgi:hypothetical protein
MSPVRFTDILLLQTTSRHHCLIIAPVHRRVSVFTTNLDAAFRLGDNYHNYLSVCVFACLLCWLSLRVVVTVLMFTDGQRYRQTDRQTDSRQTDRQTDRLQRANRPTNTKTDTWARDKLAHTNWRTELIERQSYQTNFAYIILKTNKLTRTHTNTHAQSYTSSPPPPKHTHSSFCLRFWNKPLLLSLLIINLYFSHFSPILIKLIIGIWTFRLMWTLNWILCRVVNRLLWQWHDSYWCNLTGPTN